MTTAVRLDPELLKQVAAGDAALHKLAKVKLDAVWGDPLEAVCALCETRSREGRPHWWDTHRLLLKFTQRRLPRGHPQSKVRAVERAWTQATGERLRLEGILRRKLCEKRPATTRTELGQILGVQGSTVTARARRLGLPIQVPPQATPDV